jgi:hypothetical protein
VCLALDCWSGPALVGVMNYSTDAAQCKCFLTLCVSRSSYVQMHTISCAYRYDHCKCSEGCILMQAYCIAATSCFST